MTEIIESQQQYGSILTILGENAEQNGKLLNKQITFTHIAIGDANDKYVQPDRKQTELVNEIARIPVNSVDVLQPTPESVPMLKVQAILPDDVNDIIIREFSAVAEFDGDTYFHAVGNSARIYVPNPLNNGGVNTPVTLEMIFVITSAEPIVEIDRSSVIADREYVSNYVESSTDYFFHNMSDMVTGITVGGLKIKHKKGAVYSTLDGGIKHKWLVGDEVANNFTIIDLGGGLSAKIQECNGENTQTQQHTTYADPLSQFFHGYEYSYALTKSFGTDNHLTKILHSGDSTTAGDAAGGFNPAMVMTYYAEHYGLPNTQVNVGHSGQDTVKWYMQYVDEDITNHPDMNAYFVRWGINDGSLHGDPSIYESALRQGLQKLRDFKDLSELTIVLMAPNSTYDKPNGRDEKWYEAISPIIKKAARDFQCVYFDTYGAFRDSYHGAGVYMDNPYGDGRGIHPVKEFNAVIYRHLAQMLFGSLIGLRKNLNRLSNVPSYQFLPSANVSLESYHHGISFFRALPAKGWPLDGHVKTERSADNVLTQTIVEYSDKSNRKVYERVGSVVDRTWSSFRKHGIFKLNYADGFSKFSGFDGLKVVMSGQLATLVGGATWIGEGEPDANVKVSLLPEELRPEGNVQFIAKTQRGLTFIHTMASISPDGDLNVQSPESGELIMFSMSWIPASCLD
ncbi:phage tail protein [Vibrio sp. 1075]|uniref:phage tail-collar fiber domain-containing protein n=1 Tax=Vibrio sp. 1075 TaxID=3074543 RepID=UPI002963F60F|nr:phage tail protein [Vibrio sp. 1075]MDW2310634.1 phage tail protein [Vibrio sp. 1075]